VDLGLLPARDSRVQPADTLKLRDRSRARLSPGLRGMNFSERECVDRAVGGDIEAVLAGDQRLKMVQAAHRLQRRRERLAAVAPERMQSVVALGANDPHDRIGAAIGRCDDRRDGAGDRTTPSGLDRGSRVDVAPVRDFGSGPLFRSGDSDAFVA